MNLLHSMPTSLTNPSGAALAREVMAIIGIDPRAPGWCGTANFMQAGLNAGWKSDLVLEAARKVAGSLAQRGCEPPFSVAYLAKPIIRAHLNHAESEASRAGCEQEQLVRGQS